MWCKNDKHQLPKCTEFMGQPLNDKRKHVKENRLCYGCLKSGHNAKECRYRHTCDVCKGKHPSCLHDENFKGREGREGQASMANTVSHTSDETMAATALNVTNHAEHP